MSAQSWVVVAGFSVMLIAVACRTPEPDARVAADTAQTFERDARLDSLRQLARALARDQPADMDDCRSIAFGAKPCGGPRLYLVYSNQATDSAELARVVREYNELDARRNEELGLVSDCMMVTPPRLALEGGRCVGH